MRFIRINDGVSVSVDEIESVSAKGDLKSIVKTHHNVYESNLPYNALLELIQRQPAEKKEALNIIKELETPAW